MKMGGRMMHIRITKEFVDGPYEKNCGEVGRLDDVLCRRIIRSTAPTSGKMDKPYTPHILTPGICRSGWKMVRIWPAFARPGSGCKGRQPSSFQKAAGDRRCWIGLQDTLALRGLYRSSSVYNVVSYL